MFNLALPFVVALAGAAFYVFSANSKLAELGRILFFAGVLVLIAGAAGKTFTL